MSRLFKPSRSRLAIANPTIEDALTAFLKKPLFFEAKAKTREDQRQVAIELLRSYIYYHGHKSLLADDQDLHDQFFQKKMPDHLGYHEIFGPAKIPQLLPGFLTFITYEITPVASQKFVQSTCLTIEELSLWLIRNGHIDGETGEEAAYRSAEAGRNLPRAMRALKRLHNEAQMASREEIRWTAEGESEKYKIVRLTSDLLYLENEDGETAGPIKISQKVKRDLEIGWEMHCSLVKPHGVWKITGLGGIFPRPG
jgi:hypothetical protein